MVDKRFSSDNPWAEMSGLSVAGRFGNVPAQQSPQPSHAPRTPEAKGEAPVTSSVGAAAATKAQETTDSETVEYTLEDLQEMSLKELQALAKESGIDSKGMSKDELIDALASDEVALSADDEESLEAEEIDGEMSLEEALALLGEDSETEEDFAEGEFEVVEVEVQEGDVNFEFDDNNSN